MHVSCYFRFLIFANFVPFDNHSLQGDGYITAVDLRAILLSYGFEHDETSLVAFLNDLSVSVLPASSLDVDFEISDQH